MAKRAPLSEAEKELISEKKNAGMSLRQISQELFCSYETVRKWWRNMRDQRTIRKRGRPKQGAGSSYPSSTVEKAIELKEAHPHWGPKKIRVEMQGMRSLRSARLPSPACLSVVFKQRCPTAVQPRQKRLLPPPDPTVHWVHQRWQMDAKEGIVLGTQRANVQEIRDIYSGLMIASQAFEALPSGKGWQHLHCEEHQQALRRAFSEWGLPIEVQTDNDHEFNSQTDSGFPTRFTLWLVGLGVRHVLSRPHRPTDQPHVERNHRTQGDFVWKDQSFEQLDAFQLALDYHRLSYNECYPSQAVHCHGRPPLIVFPTARTTGRPYHPDLEWDLFDLQRVDAFLATQVWTRKVAENGVVHLGGQYYILGRLWQGQFVSIRFLPQTRSFHFQSQEGVPIVDLPALGLEKETLIGAIPAHLPLTAVFQLSLPLLGV
jgi:transposase-like protein